MPGWSDTEIMECDLGRLELAVKAAVKRVEDERLFQMQLHDKKPQRPPPTKLKPQDRDKRMRESFAALPTRVVRRDDPEAANVEIRSL